MAILMGAGAIGLAKILGAGTVGAVIGSLLGRGKQEQELEAELQTQAEQDIHTPFDIDFRYEPKTHTDQRSFQYAPMYQIDSPKATMRGHQQQQESTIPHSFTPQISPVITPIQEIIPHQKLGQEALQETDQTMIMILILGGLGLGAMYLFSGGDD